MPKPSEIVAALGDINVIASHEKLQTGLVGFLTMMADAAEKCCDAERQAEIIRRAATTVETVPYHLLVELNYDYDETMLTSVLIGLWDDDVPDYIDAHDLVFTLLDKLRSRTRSSKATEQATSFLNFMGPRSWRRDDPHARSGLNARPASRRSKKRSMRHGARCCTHRRRYNR
jgi:hypothetical protein